MIDIRNYGIMLGVASLVALTHFTLNVTSDQVAEKNTSSNESQVLPELFTQADIDEKSIAGLMGVEYVSPSIDLGGAQGVATEERIILLADVKVIVRSIAIVNGEPKVRIEYEKDGQIETAKLETGQEVLGFVFSGGNGTHLYFERDGVKNQYRIFKRNET